MLWIFIINYSEKVYKIFSEMWEDFVVKVPKHLQSRESRDIIFCSEYLGEVNYSITETVKLIIGSNIVYTNWIFLIYVLSGLGISEFDSEINFYFTERYCDLDVADLCVIHRSVEFITYSLFCIFSIIICAQNSIVQTLLIFMTRTSNLKFNNFTDFRYCWAFSTVDTLTFVKSIHFFPYFIKI